mmetsp:Transcript_1173/g.3398  ORF Transcript_1173/g.3398 Transcript_1173/m.3398 type:complete len:366 (+) Transcript_1173:1117-2214(+)
MAAPVRAAHDGVELDLEQQPELHGRHLLDLVMARDRHDWARCVPVLAQDEGAGGRRAGNLERFLLGSPDPTHDLRAVVDADLGEQTLVVVEADGHADLGDPHDVGAAVHGPGDEALVLVLGLAVKGAAHRLDDGERELGLALVEVRLPSRAPLHRLVLLVRKTVPDGLEQGVIRIHGAPERQRRPDVVLELGDAGDVREGEARRDEVANVLEHREGGSYLRQFQGPHGFGAGGGRGTRWAALLRGHQAPPLQGNDGHEVKALLEEEEQGPYPAPADGADGPQGPELLGTRLLLRVPREGALLEVLVECFGDPRRYVVVLLLVEDLRNEHHVQVLIAGQLDVVGAEEPLHLPLHGGEAAAREQADT